MHPRSVAGSAVGAARVHQQPGVPHDSRAVCLLAPLVFDGQMVVGIRLVGAHVSGTVARDSNRPIDHAEYFIGVVMAAVFQPSGQAGEILAV